MHCLLRRDCFVVYKHSKTSGSTKTIFGLTLAPPPHTHHTTPHKIGNCTRKTRNHHGTALHPEYPDQYLIQRITTRRTSETLNASGGEACMHEGCLTSAFAHAATTSSGSEVLETLPARLAKCPLTPPGYITVLPATACPALDTAELVHAAIRVLGAGSA